jgi:hypothetical protein
MLFTRAIYTDKMDSLDAEVGRSFVGKAVHGLYPWQASASDLAVANRVLPKIQLWGSAEKIREPVKSKQV